MKFISTVFLFLLANNVFCAVAASKPLKIVTTLTVLKKITQDLAKDKAVVTSLTLPNEDPHFIREKPTFKKQLQEADMFIQIGRGLELWAKLVLASSQNAKINESAIGFVNASATTTLLEVPTNLSKNQGDIHPQGNPHVWLSPTETLKIANTIKNALIKNDAKNKDFYEKNYVAFKNNLTQAMFGADLVKSLSADFLWRLKNGSKLTTYLVSKKLSMGGWMKEMSEVKSPFFTYHQVFSYFAKDFNISIAGQIEEKPGISPSMKHLAALKEQGLNQNINKIIAATYYSGSKGLMDKLASDIKGKAILVQADASDNESYIEMMNRIVKAFNSF
jgi:zinc/manganese transport system substrate-binding protein